MKFKVVDGFGTIAEFLYEHDAKLFMQVCGIGNLKLENC